MGLDQLVTSITALPGLGSWTAQYIALRLGEPDAFPAADLGLRRAMTSRGTAPTPDVTDRWRPWRAVAFVHLCASGAQLEACSA